MQEEVENRSVNLAITTTRMTARAILSGIRTYLYYHNRNKASEIKDPYKHGKQSVKELIGQGQGVESIEVGDESLKTFNRIAKKYGVDFAIKKDKTVDPPHYVAFFKAKDADALQHILDEYSDKLMKKKDRPSVIEKLHKFKEYVAAHAKKERYKEKEMTR